MEEYVATEASYFNEAVRTENGKGFDISVSYKLTLSLYYNAFVQYVESNLIVV